MNKYNKPQKWRRLSSRVVFTHPRIVLAEDEVELPDGKRSSYLRQVYQGKVLFNNVIEFLFCTSIF